MDIIEKKISNLIASQFPSFYQEEGPLFIEFVKAYYEFLEGTANVRSDSWLNERFSSVSVESGNTTILGSNTKFETNFANGDLIAILRSTDTTSYDIFTINAIASNTELSITTEPEFSATKTKYTTVDQIGNPIYFARRYMEIQDIDETFENFLIHFKEEYLKNLQFINVTNTRKLVKNSLSLYRSKGTERSIELLFRLAFGITPRVYYPSSDLFKLSDGHWYVPKYLELSLTPNSRKFVNKEIKGLKSGATAFAESVIRRSVNGKFVDLLYVSSIKGTFVVGEPINTVDAILDAQECPIMVGSMTSVAIDLNGVGSNFAVGDVLDVMSSHGAEGKVRVASVANTSGLVGFEMINGGYGYTNNTTILISDYVLTLANVNLPNSTITSYVDTFDQIIEPMGDINFLLSNGTFNANDMVYTYYANSLLKGTGRILSVSTLNSTAGTLRVSVLSGNLDSTRIFTTANAIGANLSLTNGYFSISATGNVVGVSNDVTLTVNSVTGTMVKNETIYQYNANVVVVASGILRANLETSNGNLLLSNVSGAFNNAFPIYSSGGFTANLVSQTIKVGIVLVGINSFLPTGQNYIYSPNSNINATCSFVSSGAGANFDVSNSLLYSENVSLSNTKLSPYLTVNLSAATYGLPGDTNANLTSNTIHNCLQYNDVTIGKLYSLTGISAGSNYNEKPIIRVIDPEIAPYHVADTYVLKVSNATASFETGELVTQTSTGARGIIKNSNATHLTCERLNFFLANTFVVTTANTANTYLEGQTTLTTALIDAVEIISGNTLGTDAIIATSLNSAEGAVTRIDVIDSGFGYLDNEIATIGNSSSTFEGTVRLNTSGSGSGMYLSRGGFTSDGKKLFDGHYWQFYSYDILSSKTLDQYLSMLKSVVHVAGTLPFGSFYYDTEASLDTEINSFIRIE